MRSLWLHARKKSTIIVAVAGLASACSSGASSQHASSASADVTSTKAPSSSPSVDPATQLFAKVDAAKAGVTSAHVVVRVFRIDQRTGDSVDVSGSGNETFADGKTTALLMSITSVGQQGQIVRQGQMAVDKGIVYARSAHPASSAHPWVTVELSAKQLDPSVHDLVLAFEKLLTVGTPTYVAGLRPAVSDVRARLPVSVHGVRSTDYGMYIDPTKVEVGRDVITQLTQPVAMTADVNLDDAGRVVALHQQQNDGPTSFESQTAYSRYNARVVINSPPAKQVAR